MNPAAKKRLKWICAIGAVLIIAVLAIYIYFDAHSDVSVSRHESKMPMIKLEPSTVVVKVLDMSLPKNRDERAGFLWNNFSSHQAEFGLIAHSTDDWRHDFERLSDALAQKAAALKIDSESLRKSLAFVQKDTHPDIVIVPQAVYQIKFEGRLVWVITLRWEIKPGSLNHVRAYAIDQKTLEKLGYVTCM